MSFHVLPLFESMRDIPCHLRVKFVCCTFACLFELDKGALSGAHRHTKLGNTDIATLTTAGDISCWHEAIKNVVPQSE